MRILAKTVCGSVLLLALAVGALPARASSAPLSQDDVTLLLIGGASPQKMVALIEERGVGFQLTPEIEKKFRGSGADDAVIEALRKAAEHQGTGTTQRSAPLPATASPGDGSSRSPAAPAGGPGAAEQKIKDTLAENAPVRPAATPATSVAKTETPVAAPTAHASGASAPDLSDPSPARVQQIIQAFAAKETMFKLARDNYTFHQINKVEELDADDQVTGEYEQDWDILYNDNGQRIERVTYAPTDTLKQLMITEEDLDSMRNIQPFVLTTDELPEYDIKYLGHVKVDRLTAYVFSIRPKELKKGRVYFQGVVWVDDQDLQIVKSEGKTVPEVRPKHGEFNLFPRFTTWRQQIDGKFWFPTFTMADDTLYFPSGPVHMREIIKYGDYKQFKSTVKTKVVVALPNGQTQGVQGPPDKSSKP